MIKSIITSKTQSKRTSLIENELFHSIVKHYTLTVDKFTGVLPVPNLSFVNIDVNTNIDDEDDSILLNRYTILEQSNLRKLNGHNSQTFNLINSSHTPWLIPRFCDEIIDVIGMYIQPRFNKN